MSKLGKRRKQWTEEGPKLHKFQTAIKNVIPVLPDDKQKEVK